MQECELEWIRITYQWKAVYMETCTYGLGGRYGETCGFKAARRPMPSPLYARGMSFVDMCYLRKEMIWDGALHYERHKTHQLFSVTITPQMRQIMARYDDTVSPWALPCMKRGMLYTLSEMPDVNGELSPKICYRLYKYALQCYLRLLEKISVKMNCRKLTFNVARHSWATLALGLGVPVAHISEGLGHTSEKTTRFYLAQLDTRTIDRINAKVTKL